MRHLICCILLLGYTLACGPRTEQGVDSTEPDLVTAEDTMAAVPAGPAFRLLGNEPFWSLEIDSTGMVFRTPEDSAGNRFPPSQPVLVGDTLRWNSANQVSEVEAIVVPQPCSDTMSDKTWTHKAIVTIDRRRLEGCAERR